MHIHEKSLGRVSESMSFLGLMENSDRITLGHGDCVTRNVFVSALQDHQVVTCQHAMSLPSISERGSNQVGCQWRISNLRPSWLYQL